MASVNDFQLVEYDSSAAFKEKIKPLIDQLHAECKANNVQFVAMFCHGISTEKEGTCQHVHHLAFCKKDHTPMEMYAINQLALGKFEASLKYIDAAKQLMLHQTSY